MRYKNYITLTPEEARVYERKKKVILKLTAMHLDGRDTYEVVKDTVDKNKCGEGIK